MKDTQPRELGLFPKIFRFITEHALILIVSFASLFVLGGVVVQALQFQDYLHQVELAKGERLKQSKELAYWQSVVREHSDYRDAYFKIATLEYQLGNTAQAKKSLEKVLALDPNFEKARVLGEKISAK